MVLIVRFCVVQTLERAPAAPVGGKHVLFEQFWLEKGPAPVPEDASADGVFCCTGLCSVPAAEH